MTRFIQICASQNNLFALDEQGDVYQYHFNVKTWARLNKVDPGPGEGQIGDGSRPPRALGATARPVED